MSNAIGSSRESNPSRRICHLRVTCANKINVNGYETVKSKSEIDTGIFFRLNFAYGIFRLTDGPKPGGETPQKLTTTLPTKHGCKNLVLYSEALFYVRFKTIYAIIFQRKSFKGLKNHDQ